MPPKCTQTLTADSSIVVLLFFSDLTHWKEREEEEEREILTSYLAGIHTLNKYRMQLQTATRALKLNPVKTRDKDSGVLSFQ